MSVQEGNRKNLKYWDIYCELPRYSFIRGGEDEKGSVRRVTSRSGKWIEEGVISDLIDEMQAKIKLIELENRRLKNNLNN